ncbi:MAG TPA: pirin family protein [Cyclobacteriaceae bacterium]|nr:pirin family protein [Cyclobacteriaceae bacterium]
MKTRTVSHLLYGHEYDMGGIPIRQPFPTTKVDQIDPFLLLHHADVEVPNDRDPDDAGVGPHPHRGFSPVTFIFKGGVHHRDSRGNDSVIYAGGAQWMNAGMGVIHSERPPHDIHEIGGRQEIIQLWINTPAAHKMDQPAYFPLAAEDTPTSMLDNGKATLKVFSGEVAELKGPIPSHTEVNAATLDVKKGGKVSIALPSYHNVVLYLLDGKLNIDGYGLTEGRHAVFFKKDGDGVSFEALEDTRILLLSGKPLDEEVVSHGPFVMNNQTQILEAMRDYQMGKMGVLIE